MEVRLRLLGHLEEVTRRCRNENIEDGNELTPTNIDKSEEDHNHS